jgi:hypothetical protein
MVSWDETALARTDSRCDVTASHVTPCQHVGPRTAAELW